MKIIALFACLLGSLLGLGQDMQAPNPIEGVAQSKSAEFNTTMNGYEIAFHFPNKWGMGEQTMLNNDHSQLSLFPKKGGLGCTLSLDYYKDNATLKNSIQSLETLFPNSQQIQNGFEASVEEGFFLCKEEGPFLVQMWYVTPKQKDNILSWEGLKQCLTIIDPQAAVAKKGLENRVTEEPTRGWWCHHPDSDFDVLFEISPTSQAKVNLGGTRNYHVQFTDPKTSGFFYVKWNCALNKAKTYKDHLKFMEAEIKKLDSAQKSASEPMVDLNNRYATLSGSPYQFITLAGVDFLFGFAVKTNSPHLKTNLNDLSARVKWRVKGTP